MRLGIDVGGTHTDAVVIDAGRVVAQAKATTNHSELLLSVRTVLEAVLTDVAPSSITQLNLSTTLSTNAIVEGKSEDVALLVSGGPGIDPEHYQIGRFFYVLGGSIDHRGTEVAPLDSDEVRNAVQKCQESGIRASAVVSKFSTRNSEHEQILADALEPVSDFVSQGHLLSGQLSFPRRIATAYYNSAVWRTFNFFANAVEKSVYQYGITAPIHILKADGGTMPLSVARELPVESILSGPAASVMGVIALCNIQQDAVILDIGGTTTDIAVFASGFPVVENDGIAVGGHPTLVRALRTRSIGIGGDSRILLRNGVVHVGPERSGPSMVLGGAHPTLMDACCFLGYADYGDVQAGKAGIEKLAALWDVYPQQLAEQAVAFAVSHILQAVDGMVEESNSKPVYTIMELLQGGKITPRQLFVMGGPAKVLQPLLQDQSKAEVIVPESYAVANAIGAALTRSTCELELFADTEKGVQLIPAFDLQKSISGGYGLDEAREDATEALLQRISSLDIALTRDDIDITEASCFTMVGDYGTVGRNIRVKCQVRPSIEEKI